MPWEYTDEYYREYTRTTWNESAEAYTGLMARLAPLRAVLVERLAARPGDSILDLGTGPGEPALTIAGRVAPTGRVVGVDLSEAMIAIAQRSARERAVLNAEFRVMDSSRLDLEDGMFDGVVSSLGFQIFTDPDAAGREAHRVLKPGGRIAVGIWSTADRVPFLDVIIAPMLAHAEPDESGYLPTPYETAGPGEMVRLLTACGFRAATESRVSHQFSFASPEEYLEVVLRGSPIGHSLGEETPEVQAQVLRDTRSNLERYRTPEGIVLPGESVFVTARS